MNSHPDREEAASTVLIASLPFFKSDESERVKGPLLYRTGHEGRMSANQVSWVSHIMLLNGSAHPEALQTQEETPTQRGRAIRYINLLVHIL